MKTAPILALATALSAPAAIFTYDFGGINATIPDANASGISNTQTIPDTGLIQEIKVTLNIDGGANGDLYVYVAHNDRLSVLLNRPGKSTDLPNGYNDPGIQLTFQDSAANGDVHTYRQTIFGNDTTALGGPLTTDIVGPFQPDGRAVSPFTVTTDSVRTAKLSVFDLQQLSGGWTIFVADVSSGDTATLVGWSMQVTTVPEPAEITLISSLAVGAWFSLRRVRQRRS